MNRIHKQLISMVLILAMAISLLPATALAAQEDFTLHLSTYADSLTLTQGSSGSITMKPQVYRTGVEKPLDSWATADKNGYTYRFTQSYALRYKGAGDQDYQNMPEGVVTKGSGAGLTFDLSKAEELFVPGTYSIEVTGTINGTYTPKDGEAEEFTLTGTTTFSLVVIPTITSLNIQVPDTFEVDYEVTGRGYVFIPVKITNQDGVDVTPVCRVQVKLGDENYKGFTFTEENGGGYAYRYAPFAAGDQMDTRTMYIRAVYSATGSYMDTWIDSYVKSASGAIAVSVTNQDAVAAAKISGESGVRYYSTLGQAMEAAQDGETVTLLKNIGLSSPLTVSKDITIDGQDRYTLTGELKLQNGTLKDLTLTNAPGQMLLIIGSSQENTIRMEGVTVNIPLDDGSQNILIDVRNEKANITIDRCTFRNEAENGGVTENAPQWSYGLYMNANGGSFAFTRNQFDGAFRTMLANLSGTVRLEENRFTNSIYSSSGTGEATCITTAAEAVNHFTITGNTFDNAGAFYFQKTEGVAVTGNTFQFDKFEHYIQVSGGAAHPLDLTGNTFQMGDNRLVSVDKAAAPILYPAGQQAVNYWAWANTPEAARPDDYGSYVYAYQEDGSRSFYPGSDAALNAFLNPTNGNIGVTVGKQDLVTVHQDLTLSEAAALPADATLVIGDTATLTIPQGVTLTNNGTIVNPQRISAQQGAVTPGPDAVTKYSVTFQLSPETAVIALKDGSGNPVAAHSGTAYYLEDGSYTYTVSADGYHTASGAITVSGSAQTVPVALTAIPAAGPGTSAPIGDYLITVDRATGGRVTVTPGRADKGDTVTITVKPDSGYVLDHLTVTAKDGSSVKLTWKNDNECTFTMPGSQVSIRASFVKEGGQSAAALPFTDVTASDWYYDAVRYVYEKDLMNGTSAAAFSPFLTTSRAMILTVLARHDGVDTSAGSTWYEAGAVWAISKGVSDGTSLEAELTREQLVTMLWRYDGSPAAEGDLSGYPDSASVSDWAASAMLWAVKNGVITGTGAGALNPQGTATRAEVATILMRFIEH